MFENRVLRRIFGHKVEVTGVEKTTKQGALGSVFLTKYYLGDQIKKEIDRACSTYATQERCIQDFGGET